MLVKEVEETVKIELGGIIKASRTGDGYLFETETGSLGIGFVGADSISFEYSIKTHTVPRNATEAIDQICNTKRDNSPTPSESALIETPDGWAIKSGRMEVRIAKDHSSVSVFRDGILVHGGMAGGKDTVIPQSQFRLVGGRDHMTGSFYFALDDNDMFFGLGDKAGKPDRRGKRFQMYNKDALGYDASFSDPLYKSIPFLLRFNRSNRICTGYFFASPCIDSFDLGKESPFYWSADICDGPFRFYLFTGENYRDVLAQYCGLTGLPALPPLFSFGYLGSSMNYVEAYDAQARIMKFFEDVEKHKIPCEGMYVSSGYLKSDEGLRHAFVWNSRKFPDPAKFIIDLRKRGYHLTFNIKPGILKTHPEYEELAEKGYLIKDNSGRPVVEYFWGGDASFIDFTNSEACSWWKSKLKSAYLDAGAEGIWNDNNEFEFSDPDLDIWRIRTVLPCLMARSSYEACIEKNPGKRPWIYSRSGYAGIQKYARTWTGDNSSNFKTLKYNQYQGIGMGLSGLPFVGHDLGGFYGPEPSPQLLVRCCQSAIFQSRFVIHSWRENDRPTEPWKFTEVFDAIKSALTDHYRHMPYIYNEAYHSSRTGEPLERMLLLEYPEDRNLGSDEQTFMFGRSVLKAPVLNPDQTEISVRFPDGDNWYSPKTGTLIPGGEQRTFPTPLDATWYFYRTASVIPLAEPEKLTTGYFRDLTMLVLPGTGDGKEEFTYEYFEDDGESAITDNSHNIWRITVSYDVRTCTGSTRINLIHCGNSSTLKNRKVTIAFPEGFSGTETVEAGKLDGKVISFSGKYIL